MKRSFPLSIGAALLLLLGSCSEAEEIRLTPEQLAWQGYQTGEVLRFGRAQDGAVRTYKVTDIKDELYTQHVGVSFRDPPKYQRVIVSAQRIDTVARAYPVLDFDVHNDQSVDQIELRTKIAWDKLSNVKLPIDSVSRNAPIDVMRYPNTTLLTNVAIGPATYSQVLYITGKAAGNPVAQSRLYFARGGKGLVAFDEDGKGLWYRVP